MRLWERERRQDLGKHAEKYRENKTYGTGEENVLLPKKKNYFIHLLVWSEERMLWGSYLKPVQKSAS